MGGGGLLAVIALFSLAYGWYISGRIADGAFNPHYGPRSLLIEVVTVSDGAITLRDDGDPNVRRPGIWGLEWQSGGYAQVGDVLDTDDDREEIRRALLPGWPLPPAGSRARLDNFAFPGDPARMGIDFTEVHFAAPGGETPAWFVPGARSTWLIYVHGKGADRREALRMLPATAALGFPALVITYRNDVESPSGGGRYGYGASEWRDLEAAVRYALAHGASDVALVGFSMGGAIIMRFIDESALAPSVRALILDSPATDLRAILLGEMRKARVPGVYAQFALWITARRYGIDWDRLNYVARAVDLAVPTLLFHGTADDRVPIESSDRLAGLRPELIQYHRVPGAHHVGSWNVDPAGYASTVRSFLERVLPPSGTVEAGKAFGDAGEAVIAEVVLPRRTPEVLSPRGQANRLTCCSRPMPAEPSHAP